MDSIGPRILCHDANRVPILDNLVLEVIGLLQRRLYPDSAVSAGINDNAAVVAVDHDRGGIAYSKAIVSTLCWASEGMTACRGDEQKEHSDCQVAAFHLLPPGE